VPQFLGARVSLWRNGTEVRLVVVPGRLTTAVQIGSTDGLHQSLGFNNPVAAANGVLSGELTSPPLVTSHVPRLTLVMGGQPAVALTLSKPPSLAALAADLQAQIRAAGTIALYTNTRVVLSGSQLLILPGAGGVVAFGPTPDDANTVQELQLKGTFSVRVRVNGAESIDLPGASAVVSLPQ
jgi:hypothetical protein